MSGQNGGVKKPPFSVARTVSGPRRIAASSAAGFTLIEVMVALIVLVLGVLGAAAMTLTAIRDGKQAGLRSQASAMAYELSDLMRMSPGQETVFTGSTTPTAVSACWVAGCSLPEMAQNNLYEWRAKLGSANGLPNGAAVICRDAANLTSDAAGYGTCDGLVTSPLVVKIKWDEKVDNARGQTAGAPVVAAYLVVPIQPF